MKLFITAYIQIGLVAINTILLSKGKPIGIFFISFLISFIWCYNVTKVSVSKTWEKVVYSFGAGCGALSGYYLLENLNI